MDTIKNKFPHIPDRISGLNELAYNLWWSWHPEARMLFKMLNRAAWKVSVHNPVKMLHDVNKEVLDTASEDQKFLRHYDAVMAKFRADMDTRGGWFYSSVAAQEILPIAYFSAEYGLHHSLPFYAGGLGFLAGDFLKEGSDLGVPVIAVGFMYPGDICGRESPRTAGRKARVKPLIERMHPSAGCLMIKGTLW